MLESGVQYDLVRHPAKSPEPTAGASNHCVVRSLGSVRPLHAANGGACPLSVCVPHKDQTLSPHLQLVEQCAADALHEGHLGWVQGLVRTQQLPVVNGGWRGLQAAAATPNEPRL